MTYVLLYSAVLIVSAFILMLYGIDSADAIFEASSALATAGLSTGVTEECRPCSRLCSAQICCSGEWR